MVRSWWVRICSHLAHFFSSAKSLEISSKPNQLVLFVACTYFFYNLAELDGIS